MPARLLSRMSLAHISFKTWGIVLGNCVLLFVLTNLACAWYASTLRPPAQQEPSARERADAVFAKYGKDFLKKLYPDKTEAEIKEIVYGQAVIRTSYEPFAEFRSPARMSAKYNIHEAGFRLIGEAQGQWPPNPNVLNVFVFGGSTTLGGGVEDDATIPARMQEELRRQTRRSAINVYNFGVGASFSSQEVTYFQNQLRYGFVPDLVVFIDGLNDFHFWNGLSAASGYYRDSIVTIRSLNSRLGSDRGFGWHFVELLKSLPMVKLAEHLGATELKASPGAMSLPPLDPAPGETRSGKAAGQDRYAELYQDGMHITDPGRLATVIDRYLTNKDIADGAARQFGIEAMFVWQPVPLYKYDLAFHPYRLADDYRRIRYGYPMMRQLVDKKPVGANFVWCADVQEGLREVLYVDHVHYTPDMSRRVARCVADGIVGSGAFDRAWLAKFEGQGKISQRVSARREFAVAADIAPIGRFFGPRAPRSDLTLNGTLADLDGKTKSVGLIDASSSHASIHEDFPIDPGARGEGFAVSVLVKSGASPISQLVLQYLGRQQQTYHVYFNPQIMQPTSGVGLYSIDAAEHGWYKVTLAGGPPEPGAEKVRVTLIPRQGAPEDKGDIVFGGGELGVLAARLSPTKASQTR
jgi:hypothetical protein